MIVIIFRKICEESWENRHENICFIFDTMAEVTGNSDMVGYCTESCQTGDDYSTLRSTMCSSYAIMAVEVKEAAATSEVSTVSDETGEEIAYAHERLCK